MKFGGRKIKVKGNSALAIAAGVAVAFMFIATIVSVVIYKNRMEQASELLREAEYKQYDSYVVMISSDDDSDFWKQVYEAAKEYGDENRVYVDLLSQSVDDDYTRAELMEMAIASGCDGIFIEGDSAEIPQELFQKAKKAGISVITLETDVDPADRVSFIGVNSYTIANLYAKSIAPDLVENSSVMIIGNSSAEDSSTTSLINNLQEAISSEMPGEKIDFDLRIIEDEEQFASEEYIQNLFMKNDLAPFVICLDEDTTTSFYQAMIDYNKVGQIHLYGNYKTPTILTGIQHGVIKSTVSIDAESMGSAATKAFIEYRDTGYVSDYINVDTQIIDLSNVDEYLEEGSDE
ncbi:hypothetical protein CSX00_10375 [Pseudobutyrivibrio ruminis]|uniref:Periplasmic binding protein domain-containing protein n=1 Tax=Pseudobutyrivibrio ruminis TaxID=46206 RepID=A0A2G3E976_9FIRM|nr:substrate-binding domain-containing protein [Pseudobutyrivibrio ruminis]PHU39705.1 hypothetical protein CSX00_10375 [Pseudobutyrivibrio ruminis]